MRPLLQGFVLGMLLLAFDVLAQAIERYVRTMPQQTAELVLVLNDAAEHIACSDEEQCKTLLSDAVLQKVCQQGCHYPLDLASLIRSAIDVEVTVADSSISVRLSESESVLKAVTEQSACLHSSVIYAVAEEITEHLGLIADLQSIAQVTLLSKQIDQDWFDEAIWRGQVDPWLNLNVPNMLKGLERLVQRTVHSQRRVLSQQQAVRLLVHNDKSLLYRVQLASNERWHADVVKATIKNGLLQNARGQELINIDGSPNDVLFKKSILTHSTAEPALWLLQHNLIHLNNKQQLNPLLDDADDAVWHALNGVDAINGQAMPRISTMVLNKPLFMDFEKEQHLFLAGSEGYLQHFRMLDNSDWKWQSSILAKTFLDNIKQQFWNTAIKPVLTGRDGDLTAVLSKARTCPNCSVNIGLFSTYRRTAKKIDHFQFSGDQVQFLGAIEKGQIGFEQLGFTYSKPQAFMLYQNGVAKPVLLFGAGYDAAYDESNKPALAITANEGAAIYVIDAQTRQLLWRAERALDPLTTPSFAHHPDLKHAIPASFALLAAHNKKEVDRAYVADIAGQLWRLDIFQCKNESCIEQTFSLSLIAKLAKDNLLDNRRFFHAPAVWSEKGFSYLALASGNIEKPLEQVADNALYFLIDDGQSSIDEDSLTDVRYCQADQCNVSGAWKMSLRKGEQALSSPVYDGRYIWLATAQVQNMQCGLNPDIHRLYRFEVLGGTLQRHDELVLPADSLFLKPDQYNIGIMRPWIERYIAWLTSDHAQTTTPIRTAPQRGGIVIRYWREHMH